MAERRICNLLPSHRIKRAALSAAIKPFLCSAPGFAERGNPQFLRSHEQWNAGKVPSGTTNKLRGHIPNISFSPRLRFINLVSLLLAYAGARSHTCFSAKTCAPSANSTHFLHDFSSTGSPSHHTCGGSGPSSFNR